MESGLWMWIRQKLHLSLAGSQFGAGAVSSTGFEGNGFPPCPDAQGMSPKESRSKNTDLGTSAQPVVTRMSLPRQET